METLELIRQFLSEQYGIDPDIIKVETTLDELGVDSITFVELVFEFETKLGVPIPASSFSKPKTIGELVALVDDLRKGKQ